MMAGNTLILGLETSCDETSAAVVSAGGSVLSNVIASQVELHARYGGVVPELASRAHLERLLPVIDEALETAGISLGDVSAVAVTHGPGLIGALLTGLTCAKALSQALGVPLLTVNHLEAHIYASFLEHPELEPPLVALLVSGGHTMLVHMPSHRDYQMLGETLDDAAGEAYDKIARFLDLGYPGGPVIDRLSREGDPHAIRFPRAMLDDGTYNFSLSGLKTAVINYVRKSRERGEEIDLPDLVASFQEAVVEVQVVKTLRAARACGVNKVVLGGGVASNLTLRERLRASLEPEGMELFHPGRDLCMDNAAMVAYLGHHMMTDGETAGMEAEAHSVLPLPFAANR